MINKCKGFIVALLVPLLSHAFPANSAPLSCESPVSDSDSSTSLLKKYAGRAKIEELGGPGDQIWRGVRLFGDAPKKTVEVRFDDEQKMKRVASIWVHSDAKEWEAPYGLHIGSSLAEVEVLNGKPLTILGFDWDYGGMVVDFHGGKLAHPLPGNCMLSLQFDLPENGDYGKAGPIFGDKVRLASNDPLLAKLHATVSVIGLMYPIE